jgi:hypothetical protein
MHQNFKTTKLKKKKIIKKKKSALNVCMHLGHGDYDEYEWGLKH